MTVTVEVSTEPRALSAASVKVAEDLKAKGNAAFKGGAAASPREPTIPPDVIDGRRRRRRTAAAAAAGHHVPLLPLHADKHYNLAQQLYSRAIEADPTNAVLYGNRAFAAIRLEVRLGSSRGWQQPAAHRCG